VLHGKDKHARLAQGADILLINYEGMPWLATQWAEDKRLFKKLGIDTLIIDESTAYKSPRAKTRLKLLKPMLKEFEYRHILTGTPSPRSLLDLWAQIYILDRGAALGEYFTHYKTRYFYQADYLGYDWRPKPGAAVEIYRKIAPLVMRVSRSELDLPPLVDNHIYVTLPEKARAAYNDLEKRLVAEIRGKKVTAANAAVASGKCRQLASGEVYDEDRKVIFSHDAKLEALLELIDSLQGSPLLVLYEYQHEATKLQGAIKDAPRIGGGVSPKEITKIIDQWNAGKLPVLIAHAGSIAHGLNLQESGSNLCWYSMTWNLEHYQQAYQRLWRSGQKNPVINHHIVARGTVDEVILDALRNKAATQTSLLKALEKKYAQRNA
jgi:SNF2 family DNA or RNA helicase